MIKFKPGMIIKHDRFMDVAFWVEKAHGPFGKNRRNKVKGTWLNLGQLESFSLNMSQTIEIK